ncbi:hypothetical protein scyTo_0006480 [Scyliorhinus torazame]|uniref:Uncharacterized protein n=1 Tax=Scyliorhinus torazame TaxID=75743 RepID=A0A401PI52_SCYTO|nr:hypothetical protein [Scyliorhinus torazame]
MGEESCHGKERSAEATTVTTRPRRCKEQSAHGISCSARTRAGPGHDFQGRGRLARLIDSGDWSGGEAGASGKGRKLPSGDGGSRVAADRPKQLKALNLCGGRGRYLSGSRSVPVRLRPLGVGGNPVRIWNFYAIY